MGEIEKVGYPHFHFFRIMAANGWLHAIQDEQI